jgi:hypothetical protein
LTTKSIIDGRGFKMLTSFPFFQGDQAIALFGFDRKTPAHHAFNRIEPASAWRKTQRLSLATDGKPSAFRTIAADQVRRVKKEGRTCDDHHEQPSAPRARDALMKKPANRVAGAYN